jgi:putative transposase
MTASLRGLPACNTEACGLSRAAYRHLWNTTRDGQYYPAFQQLIDAAEVTRVPLPPRSPNLNAYAERWVRSVKEERWVRSVKEECLSRLIRFGEASLRHALTQ